MTDPSSACPCGSGDTFVQCCGRRHAGAPAPTAEQVMRARYSAYMLGDAGYLRTTWHASTRPDTIDLHDGPTWMGLEVRAISAGQPDDETGTVEFVARYRDGARLGVLHETSRFVREQGLWYYVDGDIHASATHKPGRNAPCPCGSGRKFKQCCAQGARTG